MTNVSLAPPPISRFLTPAGEIVGWPDGEGVRATGISYARAARFEAPQPEPPATEGTPEVWAESALIAGLSLENFASWHPSPGDLGGLRPDGTARRRRPNRAGRLSWRAVSAD